MKNLILTLVLVISSLVSYSQLLTVTTDVDNITIDNFAPSITPAYSAPAYEQNVIYIVDTTTNVILTQTQVVIQMIKFGDTINAYGTPQLYDSLHKPYVNSDTLNISGFVLDTIYVQTTIATYGHTWFKIIKISQYDWDHLGVNDLELTTTRLSAYPNPASSNITIDFDVTTNEVPVAIFSMSGQLVYSNDDNRNNGTNSLNVDVSSFQTGIYIVKAGSQTFKFVKQ